MGGEVWAKIWILLALTCTAEFEGIWLDNQEE